MRLLLLAETMSNLLKVVIKAFIGLITIAAILRIDPLDELLVELVPICLDDEKGEQAIYEAEVAADLSKDLIIRDYGHFSLQKFRVLTE